MVKTKAIFQRFEQFTCFEFVFSLVPYNNNIMLSNPLKGGCYCFEYFSISFILAPAPFSCTAHDQKFLLTSKTGTLASYNYPLPCDDSVECIWHVNVNSNSIIKLTFQFFNLSQAKNCTEDYVEVRDGPFNTSDLIGRYCGPAKPSAVTAGGWHLHVAFKSSGKKKYPGFKASYETTKISK